MTLDILAVVAALIFAAMGWRSGAVAQSMRLVAAVAAFLAATPVAELIRQMMFPDTDLSGPVVEALLVIGSGIGVYVVLAVTGWLFARAMWAASDGLTLLDRSGGVALGIFKAAVLVYFLVAAVSMAKSALVEVDEDDVLHLRDSELLEWVEEHNVLVIWRFEDLQRLHGALRVRAALDDPEVARRIRENGPASDLLRSDEMRGLAEQEGLVEAARSGAYHETLAADEVRELLNDRRFVGRLRMIEWERLLDEIERGDA